MPSNSMSSPTEMYVVAGTLTLSDFPLGSGSGALVASVLVTGTSIVAGSGSSSAMGSGFCSVQCRRLLAGVWFWIGAGDADDFWGPADHQHPLRKLGKISPKTNTR